MSAQVWLMGYSHPRGFGRAFNYRTDNLPPSETDIESMEIRIAAGNGLGQVTIISVSRLADSDGMPESKSEGL